MAASSDFPTDISSDPDEAAAQWLLRLREAAGTGRAPDMQRAFARWLEASARHRQAYERRLDEWNALEPLSDAYRRAVPVPACAMPARRRWLAGGLALAGAACAGAIAWRMLGEPAAGLQRTAVAAPGHSETLDLPDGTRIVLDSGARLSVRYQSGRRSVALQQGAAFFEVAHDPDRPFVVDAGLGEIRVLGTSFEIERADRSLTVSVLQGKVDVRDRAGDRARLGAGQGVRVWPAALGKVYPVEADRIASWRSGRLVFENTPLEDLADALARRGLARIRVAPEAAGLPVTLVMRTDDVDNALAALGDVLPVRLERRAGEMLVTRK